jgi:DNA adenine methylase
MAKYKGSKSRYANKILNAIMEDLNAEGLSTQYIIENMYFVDLFCGGCSMVKKAPCKNRIANDINPYIISYLSRIQAEGTDWLLEPFYWNITPEIYKIFKESIKNKMDNFSHACLGHVGINFSYGSDFFVGYNNDPKQTPQTLARTAFKNAQEDYQLLQNVKLINLDYRQVPIPPKSIVYCDIPYKDTSKYFDTNFDMDEFFEYTKQLAMQGHYVYYSEYSEPPAHIEGIIIDEILNYNVPILFGNGVKSSNHISNRNSIMKEVA